MLGAAEVSATRPERVLQKLSDLMHDTRVGEEVARLLQLLHAPIELLGVRLQMVHPVRGAIHVVLVRREPRFQPVRLDADVAALVRGPGVVVVEEHRNAAHLNRSVATLTQIDALR